MTENKYSYSLRDVTTYLKITSMLVFLLYFGKPLLVPLSFGLLVAIVTFPSCRWLEAKGWPRSLAVGTLITAVVLIFFALVWLLGYEINLFINDIPRIGTKLSQFLLEIRAWLDSEFGIHTEMQDNLFKRMTANLENSMNRSLGGIFATTTSTIITLVLVPVFGALFLYHRGTFVKFVEAVAGDSRKKKLNVILQQSIITYFKFIKGTFFVYCIVGLLNSIGLLALGIDHPFLFGMVAAFMTSVPYVGIIISASLLVSVALISKDSVWYAVGVVAVFSFVQYLEANVIFPRIVGHQLNLSTWAVLVAIITGTLLWGISGMILFIPFIAILKIFSDHMEELKNLNILLNRNSGYKKNKQRE